MDFEISWIKKSGIQSETVNTVKPHKEGWTFKLGNGVWGKLNRNKSSFISSKLLLVFAVVVLLTKGKKYNAFLIFTVLKCP